MESKYRIKKNLEFTRLYKRSNRFYNKNIKLLTAKNGYDYPRFGFTLTRKFGKANKRNKIKRRLKEIVRQNMDIFTEGQDYLFAPKNHTIDISYEELENSVKHIVAISKRKKNE